MRKALFLALMMIGGAGTASPLMAVVPCYKRPLDLSYQGPKETSPPPKVYATPGRGLKKADSHLNDHRGLPPERYGSYEDRRLPATAFSRGSYYSKAPADTMAGAAARSSGYGSTNRWTR
ncbi:MAG: hypothetical protein ACK5TR_02470 [Alphaproteobacteria bacterium]|jgi:hypothetical protein|nr:hypothetical protein [Alphaproteobacteria bacterium]